MVMMTMMDVRTHKLEMVAESDDDVGFARSEAASVGIDAPTRAHNLRLTTTTSRTVDRILEPCLEIIADNGNSISCSELLNADRLRASQALHISPLIGHPRTFRGSHRAQQSPP